MITENKSRKPPTVQKNGIDEAHYGVLYADARTRHMFGHYDRG